MLPHYLGADVLQQHVSLSVTMVVGVVRGCCCSARGSSAWPPSLPEQGGRRWRGAPVLDLPGCSVEVDIQGRLALAGLPAAMRLLYHWLVRLSDWPQLAPPLHAPQGGMCESGHRIEVTGTLHISLPAA